MAGIPFLRANALNAAPLFHECACPQSNGAAKAVAGKMIFNHTKKPTFGGLFYGKLFFAIAPIHIATLNVINSI